jgi:hypothetical protein
MSTPIRSLAFALVAAAAGLVEAEPFDPAARAKAIAPFVDEQTVAVAHVDLTRIEVDPLLDKLVEIVPTPPWNVERQRRALQEYRSGFLQAGAKELYFVVSLADVPRNLPVIIVPRAGEVDLKALRKGVARDDRNVVEPLGGALFVGPAPALERIRAAEPDARPELATAFEAAGDGALQVLLLPPAYAARVIRETMPTLAPEIGGGPSTILTEGVLWAAVGVDVSPKLALRLTIQSQDEQAAAALRAKWGDAVRFLSSQDAARKLVPALSEAARRTVPKVEGDRLVLTLSEAEGGVEAFSAAIGPPIERARARSRRTQSMNNLKQLAIGMHNYHDLHETFPAVGNTDAGGKMLLSWRVHLLPYLEQVRLYEQFHLDEPWDSDHNRTLIGKMPQVFRCPASKHAPGEGLSTYRVVSGEGTVFPGRKGVSTKEIEDGTSNTILLVEVDDDHAVTWTKPEPLPFHPDDPARGLGGQFDSPDGRSEKGFHAAFCDGSVQFLPLPADDENLRRLFLRADGQRAQR